MGSRCLAKVRPDYSGYSRRRRMGHRSGSDLREAWTPVDSGGIARVMAMSLFSEYSRNYWSVRRMIDVARSFFSLRLMHSGLLALTIELHPAAEASTNPSGASTVDGILQWHCSGEPTMIQIEMFQVGFLKPRFRQKSRLRRRCLVSCSHVSVVASVCVIFVISVVSIVCVAVLSLLSLLSQIIGLPSRSQDVKKSSSQEIKKSSLDPTAAVSTSIGIDISISTSSTITSQHQHGAQCHTPPFLAS